VLTLFNPALWLLGTSLGLLNACRYGFVDWGIKHLIDVQNIGVGKAALTFVVLAAGATVGTWAAGWATDRFFGSRRAPVVCVLLLFLSVLTIIYENVARLPGGGLILVGLLFLIGFCIYGPQILLVGTAPADLARHGTSAAAAGFVNFMGYMGAAAGDVVTGHLSPKSTADGQLIGEWTTAIHVWSIWALAAAICTAFLWNSTARTDSLEDESNP
jgi:sugar phosphate permease